MMRSTTSDTRPFVARAFGLVRPYWTQSPERSIAWLLLVTIVTVSLGLVYLNVQYNYWNRNFFNALEARDPRAFWLLIPYFFGLSVLTVAGGAVQTYLTQALQMRWRMWLTQEYLGAWLAGQSYYRLELDARGTDNPDQRIAEDLKQLTTATLDLSLGFLHNLVTLVSFVAILWSVSSSIAIPFLGGVWTIPGDMVWAGLVYAAIGSAATYLVGRPLIGLRFQQERLEADMRFGLMRTREHAESIALYRGEGSERARVEQRIDGLRRNWLQIMVATLKLNGLSGAYMQIGVLLPYFLASPRYFSGAIPLGGLTQIAGAFDTVRSALSWFVFNYQALAVWKASVDRLLTFDAAIASATREAASPAGIATHRRASPQIRTDGLALSLPDGTEIVESATFAISPGERVLLNGAPGAGKSCLFRALAGIWPYGRGHISLPEGRRMLFLPQKAYIPAGRLADAVAYPALADEVAPDRLRAALEAVGLAPLAARLDEHANWAAVLSGGEQQKLAVARALIARPDWLFLDEATASLDEVAEAALYRVLIDRLPDAAIVSIAHRASVASFHHRRLILENGRLSTV